MQDNKKSLVAKLSTILPTYYEYFCDTTTPMPCITYAETNNLDDVKAMDAGYYRLQMTVKIWCNALSVGTMESYAQQVDNAMRELGYSRINSNELVVGDQIEKILLYEALGIEKYNN